MSDYGSIAYPAVMINGHRVELNCETWMWPDGTHEAVSDMHPDDAKTALRTLNEHLYSSVVQSSHLGRHLFARSIVGQRYRLPVA